MKGNDKDQMEQFNENTPPEPGLDIAFETTYKIVTGKVKISNMDILKDVYMLYDPTSLDQEELIDMLLDMIDYFIETEEYEKCQKLKNILESDLSELLPKITMTPEDIVTKKKKDSMDAMIDMIKAFSKDKLDKKSDNSSWAGELKKEDTDKLFTDDELWDILSLSDKDIFENKPIKFGKWLKDLDNKSRRYYVDRLIDGFALIPSSDETAGTWKDFDKGPSYNSSDKFNYEDTYEGEDNVDYGNVVISFVGNLTCISNYSKEKINDIRFQLITLGILEVEIRTKKVGDKILYTIIYDNYGKLNKIKW
tara:strand:+ start:1153 stop:2076 length:924 start_codon:yes stop_codon:yes gene_type:complete